MMAAMPSRTSGWSSTVRTRSRWFPVIPLCVLIAAPALALNPALGVPQYAHTAWTLRDNKFTAYPRTIAQTSDGFLWLGSEFGLVRFDGVLFTPWTPPEGPRLPDKSVVRLLASRDGALWIGTRRGIARWSNGALTRYEALDGHYVAALLEDRDGVVWVGTSGGFEGSARLCAIARGTARCDGAGGRLGRFVSALHEDREGRVWVGAATGLWRWKPGAAQRYAVPGPSPEVLSVTSGAGGTLVVATNRGLRQLAGERLAPYAPQPPGRALKPTVLFRDRDDNLWIGTQDQGVLHAHQGKLDWLTRADGLSADFVVDLIEDREGSLWVATLNGLDRLRDYKVATVSSKQGLSTDSILSIAAREDGSVWLGTVSGLNRWKNGDVTSYRHRPGYPVDVGSLYEDRRGRLWVSSAQGLLRLENDAVTRVSRLAGQRVHAFTEDLDQNLWISEQERGLLRVRDDRIVEIVSWSRLQGSIARALAGDPVRLGLWLGFFQGGVAYVEGGRIVASYGEAEGLGTGAVTALHFDHERALWVSTQGGLSRVKDGRVATLTIRSGLPCDGVHWAMTDDARSMWLYTTCGLVRVEAPEIQAWIGNPARRVRATLFDSSDGVPTYFDLGSYGSKVARARDGQLWFATYAGAAVVDAERIPNNGIEPPVHIERLVADRQTYDPSAAIDLPPGVRDLRIDYTAPSLAAPEKIRYRYRLEGRDRDWIDAGSRREAFYTDLPPQAYRFRVIASNNDGVWNERGATVQFAIRPDFYETRAFRIAVVLMGAAFLWTLYRMRMRRLAAHLNMRFEERLAERSRIAQELHDTLLQGSISVSMQLHVVADSVKDSLLKPKLSRILDRLAQVIDEGRRTVDGLRSSALPGDVLEHALARDAENLQVEQAVDIRVTVEGRRRRIQPLIRDAVYRIMREALANALRHGRPTRVDLEFEYSWDGLCVIARDDGCGMEPDVARAGRSGHWGIYGMRERADQIGAHLKVSSRLRHGTEVVLVVPAHVAYGRPAPQRRLGWFRRAVGPPGEP